MKINWQHPVSVMPILGNDKGSSTKKEGFQRLSYPISNYKRYNDDQSIPNWKENISPMYQVTKTINTWKEDEVERERKRKENLLTRTSTWRIRKTYIKTIRSVTPLLYPNWFQIAGICNTLNDCIRMYVLQRVNTCYLRSCNFPHFLNILSHELHSMDYSRLHQSWLPNWQTASCS